MSRILPYTTSLTIVITGYISIVRNADIFIKSYKSNISESQKSAFLKYRHMVRRRVVKTSANGKKRSYSCNHCFSQIVICGDCGKMFRRIHWNNHGCKSVVWRCISRFEATGLECHSRTVNELDLQEIVLMRS